MIPAIQKPFEDTLCKSGFAKKSGSWYIHYPETVGVVNLQKSQYGDTYYVNLGVWVNALGEAQFPKENTCHIRIRLSALCDDTFERAMDSDSALSDDQRKKVIEAALLKKAIPFLQSTSSLSKIKEGIENGRLGEAMVHVKVKKLLSSP